MMMMMIMSRHDSLQQSCLAYILSVLKVTVMLYKQESL